MENNQENSNMSVQDESKKKCPEPPWPIEVPSDPSCPDYVKIPEDIKEVIDLNLESTKKGADEAYEESLTKAEDTKDQAKTVYDASIRKHSSAMRLLATNVEIAKKQLKLEYKKCLRDAIPQKCPSPDDPTCDKKAICVTQLKQNLAKEDVEFQKEIQKINQDKSAAGCAWKKAQEDYDSELCIAEAVKKEAYLSAELDWRKELSKALEEI
jgi:hypothetical protein